MEQKDPNSGLSTNFKTTYSLMLFVRYSAIIFDCDGVLADSEPLSCRAWNVVFEREFSVDIGTDYTAILGKSTKDTIQHYVNRHNLKINSENYDQLAKWKEEAYIDLATDNLHPIQGVKSFLDSIQTRGITIAVASSGIFSKIQFNLHQCGLDAYFSELISGTDVAHGKPAPDIFLLAAERLNIPISQCVVIEDSVLGVEAGKASGAFTIALTSTFSREPLSKADLIVDSYEQIDLNALFP
ncbi:MAG: HAD family phosphatase [Promethearchaeota archaeon]|nr:MAG: HAD family phosphatase [Candidatus Lokiarchaeota archaeon]